MSGSIDYDHADWAGARLLSPPPMPTLPAAPSGLSASAVSPTLVNLSWTDNAKGNETGFIIQRSSDDQTFTTIGTTATGVTTYADQFPVSRSADLLLPGPCDKRGGYPAASAVASAVIPSAAVTPVTTYISNLSWTSATVGYGTIHKDASINGNPLTLRGTVYAKGIGTHAVSQIVYNLAGAYTSFISDVGVDDEVTPEGGTGSVDFKVIGDGTVLFDSGVVTNKSAVVHINVSVAGVRQLTLLATNGVERLDPTTITPTGPGCKGSRRRRPLHQRHGPARRGGSAQLANRTDPDECHEHRFSTSLMPSSGSTQRHFRMPESMM